jgi:hypothetical protein
MPHRRPGRQVGLLLAPQPLARHWVDRGLGVIDRPGVAVYQHCSPTVAVPVSTAGMVTYPIVEEQRRVDVLLVTWVGLSQV